MWCRVLARGVSSFNIACRRYNTMGAGLSDAVKTHVDTHGDFLSKVGYECAEHLQEFAIALVRAVRNRTPLNVVAYCIGGEKWSVALATVLFHCIRELHGVVDAFVPAFPLHLCSSTWYRTCRGDCNLCTNGLRSDVVRDNPGAAFAVSRFNAMYLGQIGQREVA